MWGFIPHDVGEIRTGERDMRIFRAKTHPDLPKGKELVTMAMSSDNHISPLSFSPVEERLVTIINDKPLTIK